MIWKVVSVMLAFMLFVFSVSMVVENLPKEPVELKVNYLEPENASLIEYGAVPVFAKDLRFNHNLISYSINENCDASRRGEMVAAFNIFSSNVKLVFFVKEGENSDIKVECSDDLIELDNELFAAGEGGPSRIVNTSGFKIIEEGKVILYNSEDCDYPIVALHELGHVFGFDHSEDPKNIMFNVSSCDQRMSEDMIDLMVELYSIEALADARIDDISGAVRGKYLDFNISVLNEGLVGIDEINLTVLADGEIVDVLDLGNIDIGYGRTLRVESMRLDGVPEEIEFVVDASNEVRELNEENNVVKMSV